MSTQTERTNMNTKNAGKSEPGQKPPPQHADGLTPDIGDVSKLRSISNRVKLFYVSKIGGSDKRLNPFRGVPIELRYRKAEMIDSKRPELGMQDPKPYVILKATGRFVVKNENKEEMLCNVGDLVWVDLRYGIAGLVDMLPRYSNGATVALEVAWMPTAVVPLGGGKTTIQGDLAGDVLPSSRCSELGIDATIQKFLSIGGLKAAPALTTGESEVSGDDIPF
jgi:hypothetical protein